MTIKNKFFATATTAALVASAIVPVASAAVELKDADQIPTWAKEEVQELVNEDIIQGDEKGYFNPKNIVTRAAAAEMLYKAKKLSTEGTENFPDVNEKDWFFEAVVATSKAEIFEGNEKGEFKPNDKLTREQAAAVIVRAFGLTGEADLSSFDDDNKISGWAKSTMEIAVATGVVEGNGTSLKPLDSISRAEIAVMIHRAMEIAEQGDQTAEAKTALETTITEAEAVETTGKTAESVAALEAAITSAKAVLADVDATNEDYAAATTAVEEAVAGLVDEEPVDEKAEAKTALETAITEAEAVETTGKTEETVQALEAAITSAKEVVANEEATVEQLTAAKTAVEEAVAGLVDEEVVEDTFKITTATAKGFNALSNMLGSYDYVIEGTVGDESAGEVVTLTFTNEAEGFDKVETVTVDGEGNFKFQIGYDKFFGTFDKVVAEVTKDGSTIKSEEKAIEVTEAE